MLEDTTKVQLLEHMFKLQCLPNIEDGKFRTMDYVRGSTSALESYKSMSALELQQMVEDWRKTSTEVEEAATASTEDMEIDQAEQHRAAVGIHE